MRIDDIQRLVAAHYGLTVHALRGPRRDRRIARPRQVGMFLAYKCTGKSLPHIGQRFGGRDHTTALHACRRIRELAARDPAISEAVNTLESAITVYDMELAACRALFPPRPEPEPSQKPVAPSKLTPEQRIAIRLLCAQKVRQAEVARLFNVHKSTIQRVIYSFSEPGCHPLHPAVPAADHARQSAVGATR